MNRFFILLTCLTAVLSWGAPVDSHANELELIFYRAPQPLDWSSPGALFRSTQRNQRHQVSRDSRTWETYPHSISHVNVALKCGEAPPIYRGIGATKSSLSYARDFFIHGTSLDALITSVPGRFYDESEILSWLPYLRKNDYVRSIRFLLSEGQCKRAKRYLEDYQSLGLHRIYGGLRSDPLLGQGAGCAAFAMSLLAILDLIRDEFRHHWKRRLAVPLRLMTTETHSAQVGAFSFLLGANSSWASPHEPQIQLDFWDPELAYQWIDGQSAPLILDASNHPLPAGDSFVVPQSQVRSNVQRILSGFRNYLSDEEVADPTHHECRNFGFCDRPGPSELF